VIEASTCNCLPLENKNPLIGFVDLKPQWDISRVFSTTFFPALVYFFFFFFECKFTLAVSLKLDMVKFFQHTFAYEYVLANTLYSNTEKYTDVLILLQPSLGKCVIRILATISKPLRFTW
jgi:hypothetical protein